MNRVLLYSFLGVWALVGCRRADEALPSDIPAGKGALSVVLRTDGALGDAASKAAGQDTYPMTPDLLDATIKKNGEAVGAWSPMSTMPPVVYLAPGNYTLEVQTRGERQAVNAIPLYKGTTPFEVKAGVVASIDAAIRLESMVVSLTFQDGWEKLTGYKLNYYALDDPQQLSLFQVLQADNTPTAKRAYIDTPFPLGIKVEGRIDGTLRRANLLVYTELEVRRYHNLILKN